MRRTRGFIDLAFDLVDSSTHLVERTHEAVVGRWARRLASVGPARGAVRVVTGIQTGLAAGVFKSIRMVNGITRFSVNAVADVTEAGLDRSNGSDSFEPATPASLATAGTSSWYLDKLQASLNGFWGDYLNRKNRRLDLGMTLRHQGRRLPATPQAFAAAFPNPTKKICVFVHSLASTERLWSLSSEKHYGDPNVTFGSRLHTDLGFTPIYLRYNTGRHISENGRMLATLLTEVLDAYPVPVEEIALVGHSMGGLVARSAAYSARERHEPWVAQLRHVACLGSPHLGAPLE